MHRPCRIASAMAVPLVALALSACDEADPGPTRETTLDNGETAPGATLHFGETAKVRRADRAGVLELTVESIEKGDATELARTGYDASGKTPYYVRVTMTHVSGTSPDFRLLDYLSVWAGKEPLDHLTLFKAFAPCEEKAFPDRALAGVPYESCMVWTADEGTPAPDRVAFDNDDQYETGEGTEVDWT